MNGLVPVGVTGQSPSDALQDVLNRYRLPTISSGGRASGTLKSTTTTATATPTATSSPTSNYSSQASAEASVHHEASQSQPSQSSSPFTSALHPSRPNPPMVINHSLRSGQQVYAENTDLIIMGNVHSGAEAVADGNIIIFGSLKGRAVAGLQGDKSAKIIANKFQAELVSIGPAYHACETLPRTVNPNIPTTVSLKDDKLLFASIDPNTAQ
ncbi:hypothetical protein SAMD00019534_060340 [Acytostelium subglobosum LB1]|uniref:hypothetical protein n=1 Tax=Acytostelium subglobosum LB1 TaxID=1410327 RepID=UPI0006449EFC|nr:hypothetical protein SAMD00019534_060340 [Acytostelium subglobosum LB1]GAM22859.1 hypothetical protein SAMD00019534_060340 [Acytostelium subglobosum LB1]|eukprot:XP_012754086.1 hypothetical protein SAMD00019534_060340 [Acytostelium subglobosum LB1]